uniref:Uncharacterized protein n=1 Tax=Rhizophora mucronata TaxID=61149 RepID=A0A2P2PQ59_RHIMU
MRSFQSSLLVCRIIIFLLHRDVYGNFFSNPFSDLICARVSIFFTAMTLHSQKYAEQLILLFS